jgi:hypothetical protein
MTAAVAAALLPEGTFCTAFANPSLASMLRNATISTSLGLLTEVGSQLTPFAVVALLGRLVGVEIAIVT